MSPVPLSPAWRANAQPRTARRRTKNQNAAGESHTFAGARSSTATPEPGLRATTQGGMSDRDPKESAASVAREPYSNCRDMSDPMAGCGVPLFKHPDPVWDSSAACQQENHTGSLAAAGVPPRPVLAETWGEPAPPLCDHSGPGAAVLGCPLPLHQPFPAQAARPIPAPVPVANRGVPTRSVASSAPPGGGSHPLVLWCKRFLGSRFPFY